MWFYKINIAKFEEGRSCREIEYECQEGGRRRREEKEWESASGATHASAEVHLYYITAGKALNKVKQVCNSFLLYIV
jgi:hypothetical protein